MSSWTPDTDLWLERSRLNGELLAGVSYGIFFLLTIQALRALLRTEKRSGLPVADRRTILVVYVVITFILATIGFAANAKYTQMIWIDLRNAPGGPPALINLELNYWINRLALDSYYLMEWFMEALLLHRCFIVWNWQPFVVGGMSTLFLAYVAMAIVVMTESKGAVFYDIDIQLAYLVLSVGTNIVYTFLVTGRLVAMRNQIREALGREHSECYTSIAAMIIESAAMYSVLGIIFIVSFAVHSNISNLIFLSISHVQGIAQLLIIIRVAEGRAFSTDVTSRFTTNSIVFSPPRGASVHMSNIQPSTDASTDNEDSFKYPYSGSVGQTNPRLPIPTRSTSQAEEA
ncbi:hypothetical protein PLICRDRAFT_253041 [Plicaturopsis crispa FD-325 SS-3]|nr:hypothetical protein PLICRDRAFT_253041 [Plicaturopsis crispa FD-325 SS-3]